jgi:hypothetical protein
VAVAIDFETHLSDRRPIAAATFCRGKVPEKKQKRLFLMGYLFPKFDASTLIK